MNRIRDLRVAHGWHQKELADRLNVSAICISRYELEQRQLDPTTINTLCDLFNVTSDYLLCRSNSPSTVMTDDEADLLRAYRAADGDDRAIVELILKKYKEKF